MNTTTDYKTNQDVQNVENWLNWQLIFVMIKLWRAEDG